MRWRRVRRRLTWLGRMRVRRAVARCYRSIGLGPPVHVFLDSPIAAAIATGVAVGMRWLQRHPESHDALFGGPVDDAVRRRLVREAIDELVARFEYRPDPGPIADAVARVTTAPAMLLPAVVRAPAREVEAVSSAHKLAAVDGVTDGRAFDGVFENVYAAVYEELERDDRVPVPAVASPAAHAIDELMRWRGGDSARFLVRVFDTWWSARRPLHARLEDVAFATFFRRVPAIDADAVRTIARTHRAQAVFTHADFWIAADWPVVEYDERARPHRVGGPAIEWRDGAGLALLHGVRATRAVCEGRFTIADILHTGNAEVRRTMIELYERGDRGRFLREADADVMHIDYDALGHRQRLLRFELAGDEPYVGVEVTNSSPEPDGTHKRYILRVPPTMRTCRAAIAWTFGLAEDAYAPEAET